MEHTFQRVVVICSSLTMLTLSGKINFIILASRQIAREITLSKVPKTITAVWQQSDDVSSVKRDWNLRKINNICLSLRKLQLGRERTASEPGSRESVAFAGSLACSETLWSGIDSLFWLFYLISLVINKLKSNQQCWQCHETREQSYHKYYQYN